MLGTSSEGTSEETAIKTIQEHLTSAWKTAKSDKVMTYPASRETGDETKEEYIAATVAHMIVNRLFFCR